MTIGLLSFVTTGFNGGKSQVNLDSLTFAFLDLMKTAPNWNNGGGVNANGQVTPANMDANGYPTTIGTNGYYANIFIPPTTVRSGNYVCRWTGGDVTTQMRNPGTFVSGSTTGANGRFVFTPNASAVAAPLNVGCTVLGSSYITSIAVMHVNDETAWLAGNVFSTQFKNSLIAANFGVIRFLNQQPSSTNITTWATRKPVGYFSYEAQEYRASLWAGVTTNVGNDYSITFGSGAPVDKQTILLQFNASAVLNQSLPSFTASMAGTVMTVTSFPSGTPLAVGQTIIDNNSLVAGNTTITSLGTGTGGNGTYNISNSQTVASETMSSRGSNAAMFPGGSTVNWTAHGLVAGDVVGFNATPPAGIFPGGTYYVIATGLTANAFQISLTRGGAAYNYGTVPAGTTVGSRIPTLNLNGTGTVAIMASTGDTITDAIFLPSAPAVSIWACLVYDADLNSWILNGGSANQGSAGIINGCPYEIMLQLCKEVGAHPHFVSPYLAIDPMTDFHTQLATLVKTTMPSWMIPRFETVNEPWNNANPMTQYAYVKAYAHWNTQFASGTFDIQNWIGKTASTMGQAVNAVYGGAVGTGYQILISGGQPDQFTSPGANGFTARLESTEYVAQSAAAQPGYTKSAAYLWATHVTGNNYFSPSRRDTAQEVTDAATFALNAASIVGSISGGTLTVASVTNGTLVIGQTITDQYGLIPAGVTITGGSGTSWTVSNGALSIMAGTTIFAQNATALALAVSYADTLDGVAAGFNLAKCKLLMTNMFNWGATYTNSAGHALKGNLYEGGYSPDLNSSAQINALRNASKMVADVGVAIGGGTFANASVVTGNYADCIAAGGEFPSCFQLAGTSNIWSVLDPDIYATQTAQWNAIAAFNH